MIGPRLYELGGQYLEVRCCCQPQKLLGWLPVPASVELGVGVVVQFTVRERGVEWTLDRRSAEDERPFTFRTVPAEHISLPVARVDTGHSTWLAFKSEETPLVQLRRIPGFVEARTDGA